MNNDNQSNQEHVIGEMFDTANIAQPSPSPRQSIPGSITVDNIQPPSERRGFTVDNIQQPAPQPQTDDNGFTSDNVQQPEPQLIQEKNDE